MARQLRVLASGWLLSRREVSVYAYALVAFWSYTTITRVLLRALWLRSIQTPNALSALDFLLVHVAFAPALFIAHAGAYQVGLPASRLRAAIAKHLVILVFVFLAARLSYLIVTAFIASRAGDHDIAVNAALFWADPLAALGGSFELTSFYGIALVLAAGVVNWRRYHLEALATSELALDAERSRSMALRHQLDPHSLYNTLNAISGSVRSAPAIAIEMLARLGELLRLTLRDETSESRLVDEFAIAERYLALYQLRYPDRLSFGIELAAACRDAALPPLLLQPLVENAALHGVNGEAANVVVRLEAAPVGSDRIQITISNPSESPDLLVSPPHSPGIGLRNTWERLKLSYGADFSLEWLPNVDSLAILRLEIPRTIPGSYSCSEPLTPSRRSRPGDVRRS